MARIRSIKPEFFVSAQVADCSPTSRLLFVGLWIFSDDAGRHPANVKQLKMEVFPGDPFDNDQMRQLVNELIANDLLIEYEAEYGGETRNFWQITGWKHQKIEKPRVKYPPPNGDNIRRPVDDVSTTSPRLVDDAQPYDRSGVDRSGRDKTYIPSSGDDKNTQDMASELMTIWNNRANEVSEIASVRKLSSERKAKIRARLRDPEYLRIFADSLEKLPIPNDAKFTWQPTFDWMIANGTNALKLLEGEYDRKPSTTTSTDEQSFDDFVAEYDAKKAKQEANP